MSWRDQVLGVELGGVELDHRAARVAVLGLDRLQLVADDLRDPLGARQDVEQVDDLLDDLAVLLDDLVLLEAGEPLQAHLQDLLRLHVREPVHVARQPDRRVDALGLERGNVGAGALEHLACDAGAPAARHQAFLGDRRRRRRLDQLDHLVDVGDRDRQALEDVAAIARLAQLERGAPRDHLAPVREERLEHLAQVEQPGLAVDQRHHVDAERVLQLGLLVQVVQDDFGHLAALQLDHHAHARLVGLVADVGDAVDLLVVDQVGDPLEQQPLVDLVGKLVDDDRAAVAAVDFLEVRLRAHDHAATAGAVALAHALDAVDDAGGGKVGRRDELDQLVDRGLGPAQQREAGLDDLAQVVRRDVGGHPHGNARRAVDQQVRDARGQDGGLVLLAVVVRLEVDRFLVDVGKHLAGQALQPALGVAHRRRVVAVDRAEVALAVDEQVAQREILRHAHQRVVDRRVAVRVVLAHHVADDARALHERPVPDVVDLVHREQHAAMDRLEPVAHVGQRAPDDHAHRVVEVRAAHFLFEADREGFLGELVHAGRISGMRGQKAEIAAAKGSS